MLHGNNKSDAELARALDAGVGRIVVDSFDEIDRLERLIAPGRRAGTAPARPRCSSASPRASRPTPTSSSGPGRRTRSSGSGWRREQRPRPSTASGATPGVELVGIHAHIGSQVFRAESFAEEVEVLADFFVPLGLPELCVGGGLGVPYVAAETAPDDRRVGGHGATTRAAAPGSPSGVRVTAEPGRAVVATAGVTLYRVGTIKELPGVRTYVAVDGGMSDNPRPVLYGSGYEAFLPRADRRRRGRGR